LFLAALGFELSTSHLLSRHPYGLSHSASLQSHGGKEKEVMAGWRCIPIISALWRQEVLQFEASLIYLGRPCLKTTTKKKKKKKKKKKRSKLWHIDKRRWEL
jgi:hypothetical protein